MKSERVGRKLYFVCAIVSFSLLLSVHPAWSGSLRINMSDGSTVEVPYYWEEADEIKFEIPGGVAGVPKTQVSSVQEVLAAREFDPKVLLDSPMDRSNLDQQNMLKEIVASKTPSGTPYEKVSAEDANRLLELSSARQRISGQSGEQVHGPRYAMEGDFAELVKTESNGVILVLRNVLSSRSDLRNQNFQLTLYDGEGAVLLRKPCDVKLLDVDQKTLRKMEIRGNLYSVMGTVKPDPSIKRYEITSVSR